MVYELKDTSKVNGIFADWQETLIYSCLQNVMGKIYVTDTEKPESAFAFVGCFGFFAGRPDRELVSHKPDGFVIFVPQNEEWSALIEVCYPSAKKVERFAIKKDTNFDVEKLRKEIDRLPPECKLRQIDAALYDQCLESPVTADFVSAFDSKEQYLNIGRGMVILKDGKIVSGASSYTRYNEGIEIEVDTLPSERRKHLATIACSALILKCLEEGLYPSWDAQNIHSVRLAEKLGYEFDHAYTAYEVVAEARTHSRFNEISQISFSEARLESLTDSTNSERLIIYIHGKGGNAEEANHYRPLFPESDVVGFDYTSQTPWDAQIEFSKFFDSYSKGYDEVILIANSIGAFFSMSALAEKSISKALFISPIVNMEKLIADMMLWANVTEDELQSKKQIPTEFGETLSWEYLCYVRKHPIEWNIPTCILYGGKDHLTSRETISEFAEKQGADLTVMEDGEHWFHTVEQMQFLDDWIRRYIS